jgi:hypothetical protein
MQKTLDFPRNAARDGGERKMQIVMGRPLEVLQGVLVQQFADADRDKVTAGDGLRHFVSVADS